MAAPEEVQAIMAAHSPHFSLTAEGKVKCELNGHTFPARADALNAFIKWVGAVGGREWRQAAGGGSSSGPLMHGQPQPVWKQRWPSADRLCLAISLCSE